MKINKRIESKSILLVSGLMVLAFYVVVGLTGCASMRSMFAVDNPDARMAPISNPFDPGASDQAKKNENIILRTKKGDRSVEVELPASTSQMTDFTIPMSPSFREDGRSPSSSGDGMTDERYKDHSPSIADREITTSLPQSSSADEVSRREIENGLGVVPTEDSAPDHDKSYLASLDHIKQLYRYGRYEAALLETDELVRAYPTDTKLYEMRGTLFDRIGKTDLALKSWTQALRLNPKNESLRRYIDRKQQKRGLASP